MSIHSFCLVTEVPKQTHKMEAIPQTLLEPLGIALSTSPAFDSSTLSWVPD